MSILKRNTRGAIKLSGLLLALGLTTQSHACAVEPYIGSVCTVAFNFCPKGYLPANGATMPINQYQALYSLLGITYGGDGRATFMLPDLRGRSAIGSGQGAGLSYMTYGNAVGAESVILSTANLAAHSHGFTPSGGSAAQTLPVQVTVTLNANTAAGTSSTPANGSYLAKVPTQSLSQGETVDTKIWSTTPPATGSAVAVGGLTAGGSVTLPASASGGTVSMTGSSTPVATRSPALVMTACIATDGVYPSRP